LQIFCAVSSLSLFSCHSFLLTSLLAPATRRLEEEARLGALLRRAWANGGEGFLVAARASTDAVARH
jgi:hypothetical protein